MQNNNKKVQRHWHRNLYVLGFIILVCKIFLPFFYKIKIKGIEKIPEDSAFVLLPKHQRWVDIPFIAMTSSRHLFYIAKHELFIKPVSNWFILSLGGLPLNRERPIESRRSLYAMIKLLKKGEGLVVFPEGTYYENHMGPGNLGIVRLILARLTLPFIPVGISYKKTGFRTEVCISFGDAIHFDMHKKGKKSKNSSQEFLDTIMKKIAVLSNLD